MGSVSEAELTGSLSDKRKIFKAEAARLITAAARDISEIWSNPTLTPKRPAQALIHRVEPGLFLPLSFARHRRNDFNFVLDPLAYRDHVKLGIAKLGDRNVVTVDHLDGPAVQRSATSRAEAPSSSALSIARFAIRRRLSGRSRSAICNAILNGCCQRRFRRKRRLQAPAGAKARTGSLRHQQPARRKTRPATIRLTASPTGTPSTVEIRQSARTTTSAGSSNLRKPPARPRRTR